ncbi:LuxR family transcriptional regulator [Fusobacterium nucleatum]|uniref:LuxR family transcriptional regulator n=1 Tax=Fusobacterium nucleatum TaxID=851 RepID=A0A2N6TKP4_FUSNU|nr:endonuclease/exonuclease/phosphatase family protein [Fusobacterium nucleatum]MCL4585710.1 LuxR family transcriptional regulator [Fusobacterium nucleatum YWH7055]PMC69900.1 LuxR family transcriptional regulator [Fusobacterium nucleatum]
MKKGKLLSIIFALFFILSTLSLAAEAYIASFNILRLGAVKKDIVQTAKILKGFDIVGLVEVINRNGVEELVDELNKQSDEKWDYHISPFGVGSSKYKEYFAYIYKKDKVKFIKSEGFYKNGKSSLLREPYGATFQIGNFDFTFVLVHTIYGNNESQRKAENYKMVDVYNYFQDRDEKENDIFIAGDFNLYALDESFRPLYKHADKITYAIDPAIKTTIGAKGRANSYDNFFFSQKYSQEFTGSSGALDFSGDNPKLMREIVSDHIPVFIVVETSKDDD